MRFRFCLVWVASLAAAACGTRTLDPFENEPPIVVRGRVWVRPNPIQLQIEPTRTGASCAEFVFTTVSDAELTIRSVEVVGGPGIYLPAGSSYPRTMDGGGGEGSELCWDPTQPWPSDARLVIHTDDSLVPDVEVPIVQVAKLVRDPMGIWDNGLFQDVGPWVDPYPVRFNAAAGAEIASVQIALQGIEPIVAYEVTTSGPRVSVLSATCRYPGGETLDLPCTAGEDDEEEAFTIVVSLEYQPVDGEPTSEALRLVFANLDHQPYALEVPIEIL